MPRSRRRGRQTEATKPSVSGEGWTKPVPMLPTRAAGEFEEEAEIGDAESPASRVDPAGARGTAARARLRPVFTSKYDEIVAAQDLCDAEELDRLRTYLDKQH